MDMMIFPDWGHMIRMQALHALYLPVTSFKDKGTQGCDHMYGIVIVLVENDVFRKIAYFETINGL
jgi:hypothetical protein